MFTVELDDTTICIMIYYNEQNWWNVTLDNLLEILK